jgi:hypothetical protein
MILYTGAPNYTKWGEDNFLQKGDQVHIAAYNAKLIDEPLIEDMFQRRALINADAILSFSQTVA